MYNKGDFHMHTTSSDGTLRPKDVVKLAKTNGVDIISITDHDNTEGLNEAILEGELLGIRVIPGLELSTDYKGESIHVLAFFKDDSYKNPEFQSFLHEIVLHRVERAKTIVINLLKYFNINIDYREVLKLADGAVARPHIAKAILNAGYKFEYEEIFQTMLSRTSPAFIPNKKVPVEEGLRMLRGVNAVTVLAHPILIKKSPIEEVLKFDFDGMEARYIQNPEGETERLIAIAKKHGKVITAGTDFHTNDLYDTKHGTVGTTHLNGTEIEEFLKYFI